MDQPELSQPETERRIEGWKDIADYFGRGVRTVQDWQSEGLPIYRFKKRVWAFESELAEWRRLREGEPAVETAVPIQIAPPTWRSAASLRTRWIAGGGVVLAAVVAAWVAVSYFHRPGSPVRWTVAGALLRTFDARNRLVWEFPLPSAPLPALGSAWDDHAALFSDLDGDGKNELLFVYFPKTDLQNGSTLYCFRADGSVAWKQGMGRRLTTSIGQELGANYNIFGLAALARPRSDGGRIVVVSNHVWSWPSQVAVLTAQGKLVSEYWHPGWLMALTLADLNRDGVEEVILGGVNNSCGQTGEGDYGAALVILDSRSVAGFGTACSSYWGLPGLPSAPELAVMQFPEATSHNLASAYYWVYRVRVVGGQLEIDVQNNEAPSSGNVIYRFSETLGVVAITPDSIVSAKLLKGPGPDSMAAVRQKLGDVKVLRNVFAQPHSGMP
jgi:hypothetical protein